MEINLSNPSNSKDKTAFYQIYDKETQEFV